jgi:hypothetical protein
MAIRIRYTPTELSEGAVEVLRDVDYFVIQDDNTLELRRSTRQGKYRVVGFVHSSRWMSVVSVADESIT